MDVGEAEVPAAITVSQTRMVKAHQMYDGRVKIVNVNQLFSRAKSKIIRRPMDVTAF